MAFTYNFNAVRGIQASRTYFITMVPCKLLGKLFVTDHEDILPEYRAQRKLNNSRIPIIKKYILDNRNSYVFSALSASVNGDMKFISPDNSDIGVLEIDMNSVFLINDGQHRKAAIEEAISEDPSLGDETISIVFFHDLGLNRSQQMFTDLNKHAVNTSKSLNTLYDYRNPIAVFTKELVDEIDFFRLYTDKERDTLGKFSQKLFTLNNFMIANERLFSGIEVNDQNKKKVKNYWLIVTDSINEWNDLKNKEITKQALRSNYIITQGVVMMAFGKLGNFIIKNYNELPIMMIKKLGTINWQRSNSIWHGRTLRDGRVDKSDRSINLTYIKIKELIGIKLNESEVIQNKSVQ